MVDITFPDGIKNTINEDIMNGDNGFSDCAESSSFPVGAVVCKTLTLSINNDQEQWKNYNFYNAKVHAYLKVNGLEEKIDKGTYTITEPEQYSDIITLTALDDMYKANKTYTSGLKLPQSLINLVRDACETLKIGMNLTMEHGDIIIRSIPDSMTFRQLFGYAAMIESANARIDYSGNLRFLKWDFGKMESDNAATVDADGFIHFGDANPSIDTDSFVSLPGWTINAEGFLALTSGPGSDVQRLMAYANPPALSSDDIVITGVRLKNGETNDNTDTDYSGMYGEEGYVLELENELIDSDQLETVASIIGEQLVGVKFRNLEGDLVYEPAVEFGDMVYTYDRLGNKYVTPLTDVSGNVGGLTTVKTQADDPIRGSSNFYSDSTKAIVAARKMVKKETSAREEAMQKLNDRISNASGMYSTDVEQADGSIIRYLHDKKTLGESLNVIKITSDAIGFSTDGGKTYPYGVTVDGETITRLLYAEGINADYINAGTLIVRDKSGKAIFEADMDTGSVTLDGSCVTIGGKPLDEKIEDVENMAALARNMTLQLSNEYQGIPVDKNGNYATFPNCETTATVMYGTQDITSDCTYTITPSSNVLSNWNELTKTCTIAGLTANSGWVDIRAVYLNNLAVTKRFSIAKQYAGAQGEPGTPGRTYFLRANAELLLMGADKKISPATLTVSAFYRDGQKEEENLRGYWKVEKSTDSGNSWSEISTSYTTVVKTINIAVNTISLAAHDMLRVSVYSDAEKTILCDRQSFSIAIDVAALTQEDIVDILSNDGSWKGLYYLDRHLYISFDAAKGGTLILGGKNNGDGTQILYDANGKRVSKSDNDGTLYYKTYTDENNYTGFLFNKNGISFVEWVKGVETITPGIVNFTADRTYINNNVYVYGWEGKARRKPVTSANDVGSRIDYIGTGTGTTGGKEYRRMAVRGQWGSTTENYYATDYVYTNTGVSDIRLKDNVKNSETDALETVNRMKVRQFDWKKGGHQNIGFVADELEEIDPNLALGGGYDENGEMDVKQINTSYLLNYAIKAIQELSATVKEQGCKIRELEEKLDGIKGN
nr:MAG TPA: tail protein [Caudoviricetes sp.]